MEKKDLRFYNVAALFVSAMMGAGFASGREGWQFFGVFGMKGYVGIAFTGIGFILLGIMVGYLARTLQTADFGVIISCIDSPKVAAAVGYYMAAILYTIIISMSAAGGAFLNQQFGIHRAIGGFIITILVIITILGDFERVSKVFKKLVPVLFFADVILCIIIIAMPIEQSGETSGFPTSALAPNWIIATIIYIGYNIMGMIPIVGKGAINSKNETHAVAGAGLGGLFSILLTFLMITAMRKDMAFSQASALPILAYSARISPIANVIFGVVLFAAIYAAATSNFYGFYSKVPEGPKKKYIIIISALCGYVVGLTGFKNVVAYLYPMIGYSALIIMLMITVNFIKVLVKQRKSGNEK